MKKTRKRRQKGGGEIEDLRKDLIEYFRVLKKTDDDKNLYPSVEFINNIKKTELKNIYDKAKKTVNILKSSSSKGSNANSPMPGGRKTKQKRKGGKRKGGRTRKQRGGFIWTALGIGALGAAGLYLYKKYTEHQLQQLRLRYGGAVPDQFLGTEAYPPTAPAPHARGPRGTSRTHARYYPDRYQPWENAMIWGMDYADHGQGCPMSAREQQDNQLWNQQMRDEEDRQRIVKEWAVSAFKDAGKKRAAEREWAPGGAGASALFERARRSGKWKNDEASSRRPTEAPRRRRSTRRSKSPNPAASGGVEN